MKPMDGYKRWADGWNIKSGPGSTLDRIITLGTEYDLPYLFHALELIPHIPPSERKKICTAIMTIARRIGKEEEIAAKLVAYNL